MAATTKFEFIMKLKFHFLQTALVLLASIHQAAALGAQFFRISGPAATTLIAFQPDGTLVWSNTQPGVTYSVQTVSSLPSGTNWVDYVQIPASDFLNTNQLVDFNPPAGMALIPAGSFTMGDTLDGESNAVPTNVYVSAFYMDVNLVSYRQWQSVYSWAMTNGYVFSVGSGKATNHPVQEVDWYYAVKWSNARSQHAGLTPAYYTDTNLTQVYTTGERIPYVNWTANGYRLPTEAEWEKAARGGLSEQRFPWGNTISECQANYYGATNYYSYDSGPNGFNATFATGAQPYTSPVGYFAPNDYGIYDMAGNLFEWCWDWYGTPYGQPTTTNPTGPASPTSVDRVLRGGNWGGSAIVACCATRYGDTPGDAHSGIGFRCARGF